MIPHKMTIAEAKQIGLVAWLASLGLQPKKVSGDDHWYLSPLRNENSASFKVNSKRNLWYDFGNAKGGNIIDLGILLYNCTVAEFLEKLNGQLHTNDFSFHPQPFKSNGKGQPKILIKEVKELQSATLKTYLQSRCINFENARQYLKEIAITVNDTKYQVLGLPNNAGGFELRGVGNFKSSTRQKITQVLKTGKTHWPFLKACSIF